MQAPREKPITPGRDRSRHRGQAIPSLIVDLPGERDVSLLPATLLFSLSLDRSSPQASG